MKLDRRKKNYPNDSDYSDRRLDKLHQLLTDFAIKFHEVFVTENGIATTSLNTDNQYDNGVYRWLMTIGETGRTLDIRGKERLDDEDDKSSKLVRERMQIIFTTQQCIEIMDMPQFKHLYEEIAGIYFPRLVFHAEKKAERKEHLCRQVIEGVVAATSNAYNEDAFEKLTHYPSSEIKQIVSIPDPNQECANVTRAAKTNIRFFTWGTFSSYLRACMEDENLSEDQLRLLRDLIREPHYDGFLQNHMSRRVLGGDTSMSYIDAVKSEDNPRTKELFETIDALESLLTEEIMIGFCERGQIPQRIQDKVNEIVNKVTKSDYQSPDDDVLRDAYARELLKLHENHEDSGGEVLITMEFCVFNVLDAETRKILFPDDSEIFEQLDCDGEVAERVIQTPKGPNFKIMYSSHIAFGQNNTCYQRVKNLKRMIASMAVNNSAGILGKQAFDNEREMITCFLMIWFGYNGSSTDIKGSFYDARNSVVGKGICSPWFARKGVKMTANQIDVSEKAAVFLRCFLGQDRFNAVLTCSGKLASRRKPSPLDDTEQIEVWKGNKEKKREYQKEYIERPGNKEKKREYDKEYNARPGNKEKQREYQKEYNERPENKEKRREYQKEYNERPENKEKNKEKKREYRQKVRKRSEEITFQTANIALNEYKQRLKEGTLNHLAKREWKSLLAYIIKQDPKGKLDTISKYTNVDKMKNRLGVTNTDTKDCLSKYFPKE